MKNQTYRMTMLFDFYGELLTERQKEFFDLYYNEDLSLGEIAENAGISRQGVYDAVHRGARQLEQYERQLGLLERYRRLTQGLGDCLSILRDAPGDEAQRARELLAGLLSQEEE